MKCPEPKIDEKCKEFLHTLNNLDFGSLAYKLMNPEDRPGLSFEQTLDAITKYKGFLFLCYANRGKAISPSRYIDYVWHTHILDTELYFAQTALLFGHYLHHFPFFGKRSEGDERDLLAAAEFTKSQALSYFGWDEGDWCATGRKPKIPRPHASLLELVNIISPASLNDVSNLNPETITIQSGNFRHTVEHLNTQADTLYPFSFSRQDRLEQILKLPIWVIVCMPVDLGLINEVVKIKQEPLGDIIKQLVDNRLTPEGFSNTQVNLQIGH